MRFKDSVFHRILEAGLAGIGDPAATLRPHRAETRAFLAGIPEAKGTYAYSAGKWTVAEVVDHLCDTQIVFLSRLLYIARGDAPPLPGFDEQAWIGSSGHRDPGLAELRELHDRGAAHVEALVSTLPARALARTGNANGMDITAEEVLRYFIAHEAHHLAVLRNRYL